MLREKLARFDSYETRTAMLFGWLLAFCLFAIYISLQSPDFDFAIFPLAVFAFMTFVSMITYFARAFARSASDLANDVADIATDDASLANDEVELQPVDEAMLKRRAHFYAFIYGVVRQGVIGENAWAKRGLPEATYRKWIKLLEEDGIVSEGGPGKQRTARVDLATALAIIAKNTGDTEFWKPVRDYYHPADSGKTLLVMDEEAV